MYNTALISQEDRNRKFRDKFIAVVRERGRKGGGDFPYLHHTFGERILSSEIPPLPGSHLPLMLMKSLKTRILLTTKGLVIYFTDGSKFNYEWSELDFIASQDLATDDFTFSFGKNPAALIDTYKTPVIAVASVLCFVGWLIVVSFNMDDATPILNVFKTIVFFIVTPFLIMVCGFIAGFVAEVFFKRIYFAIFPERFNSVCINLRKKAFNVQPSAHIEEITDCIKIALRIYRLQQAKYGNA